ncbi:MAG: sugar ABC transporter ATP-binding protein [Nitrososphaerota archaeon]
MLKNIVKEFYGVKVLDNVSLTLWPGEVHCLLGHNGAGKTVLMKILSGVYKPDAGEIWIEGKKIEELNPKKAKELGILRIPQDPELVDDLTMAENIFMGDLPGAFFNPKTLYNNRALSEILQKLDIKINLKKLIKDCSRAEKQIVMLIRALLRRPKVIIFDEITAPLGIKEQNVIMSLIKELKQHNIGIFYISHRLEEVLKIGDTATVLRNGRLVITKPVKEIKGISELAAYILGREVDQELWCSSRKIKSINTPVILEIRNMSGDRFEKINLTVKKGEIVGVFGPVGSGKSELAETIFGWRKARSGEIYLRGEKVIIKSPKDAIKIGLGLIPEERDALGIIPYMSVSDNIVLPSLKKFQTILKIFLNVRGIINFTRSFITKLKIIVPNEFTQTRFLSGGNKQKVVVAKWLAAKCDVLLLDEPTKGIDVGSKLDIFNIINELAEDGKALIVFSSDVDEILRLCDRVYCMKEGRIISEIGREEMSRETLLNITLGEAYVSA